TFSGSSENQFVDFHKSDLPSGLDIDLYTLDEINIESIDSCNSSHYDRIFLDRREEYQCIRETLYSALPVSLGFSLMVLQ
ncbi:MAG: hypothetical protein K2Q18_02010, partial [Bdellovibrionales bacterium]|nr:hypothetical protein [Bdellovibrionales bacterium]